MIFTQRQLEHLLKTHGRIVLPFRARLSPQAQDWVRHSKVQIDYSDDQPRAADSCACVKRARPYLWWSDGPDGVAKAAITMSAREVQLQPMAILEDASRAVAAIRHLNRQVKDNQAAGGVLLVKNAGMALIFANKASHLRATIAGARSAVEEAMKAVAANVLVIERERWSLSQLRNTLIHFCRTERQMDAVVKSELEELAAGGHR